MAQDNLYGFFENQLQDELTNTDNANDVVGKTTPSNNGMSAGNLINAGFQASESLIPGASKNPYLMAAKSNPLMKAGLKTMNPLILGAGLVTTAFMGSKAKKNQEILKNQTSTNEKNKNVLMQGLEGKKNEVSDFYAGQRKGAGNAYGISDIDNFLQQNRV